MVSLSLIIASCGRPERLAKCLDAVQVALRNWGGQGETIVVDNHPRYEAESVVRRQSMDDREQEAGAEGRGESADRRRRTTGGSLQSVVCSPLRYLRSKPFSKARALNVGIAAAQGVWLVFTDDDTIPADDWLARGAEFAARTGLRAFGGRVEPAWLNVKPPRWLTPGRSGRAPGYGAVVGYAPLPASGTLGPDDTVPFGANLFVRREVFARYGGYDEALWDLCGNHALGVEDGEFGMRIRAAGEPVGYCREAVVTHPVYADRCTLRNHARLAYHYGWREPILFPNPARPWLEPYRLRLIAARLARLAADWLRGDPAGAADDWVEAARQIGGIACRWSAAYRMAMRRLAA